VQKTLLLLLIFREKQIILYRPQMLFNTYFINIITSPKKKTRGNWWPQVRKFVKDKTTIVFRFLNFKIEIYDFLFSSRMKTFFYAPNFILCSNHVVFIWIFNCWNNFQFDFQRAASFCCLFGLQLATALTVQDEICINLALKSHGLCTAHKLKKNTLYVYVWDSKQKKFNWKEWNFYYSERVSLEISNLSPFFVVLETQMLFNIY